MASTTSAAFNAISIFLRCTLFRVIRRVAPTGNCLFVAIAVQLIAFGLLDSSSFESEEQAGKLLREQVAKHLSLASKREYFKSLLGIDDDDWEDFMCDLRTDGRFRNVESPAVMLVISELYNVQIDVHRVT